MFLSRNDSLLASVVPSGRMRVPRRPASAQERGTWREENAPCVGETKRGMCVRAGGREIAKMEREGVSPGFRGLEASIVLAGESLEKKGGVGMRE